MNRTGNTLLLILLAALALGLRMEGITRPFDNGLRGECGAAYSIMAENILRYGARATGLLPVMNTLPVPPDRFVYYEHHPPGMVILTAGVFALLGNTGEAAARLLPLLFSLLAIVLLFHWVRIVSGTGTAVLAAAFGAVLPLSAYYGPFLNFETFYLPFLLAFLHTHRRWVERRDPVLFRRALLFLCAGVLMDWTVLLALPAVGLDALLFRRTKNPPEIPSKAGIRRDRGPGRALLWYTFAGICTFIALQLWFHLQACRHGSPSQGWAERLLYYRQATFLAPGFEATVFLERVGTHLARLATVPVLAAAGVGLLLLVFRRGEAEDTRARRRWEARSLLLLLGPGILNLLLFANHAARHEYWILPLFPGLCWAAALGFLGLSERVRRRLGEGDRIAAGGILLLSAAVVIHGAWRTTEILSERRGREELYHRGRAYRPLCEGPSLVLTPVRQPAQVIRYAGGGIYPYGVPDPDALAAQRVLLDKYGYLAYPRIFAVPLEDRERFRRSLEAFGRLGKAVERSGFVVIPLP